MLSFANLPLQLALLLSAICLNVFAKPAPVTRPAEGFSMNLKRRSPGQRTPQEIGAWLKKNRERLMSKYGGDKIERRETGTNLIVNQNYDSSFYGSIAVGTPARAYNVILDTGSADLWLASSQCTVGCDGIETFDASLSSSFVDKNTSFSIQYGSGSASASLVSDTVQMAGFSVSSQLFALCNIVDNIIEAPVSGLLGLGFSTISASGATPFWQTLVQSGAWDSPLMSFQLTRYGDDNNAQSLEPGGTFTMGFVNSTLYTGDIEYLDIPENEVGFWSLNLASVTVQGSPIALGSGNSLLAAIDTGTTAIGGPPEYVAAIYAQIPGAAAGTGQYENYYTYPCSTSVSITMSFGGRSWAINNDDFMLFQLSRDTCVGAFFDLTTGSNTPSWIVGDTFLKNVYSVFRYNPPSVGFAQLSDYSLSLNGQDAAIVPSPTIGSIVAEASATDGTNSKSRASSAAKNMPRGFLLMISFLVFFL